MPELTVNMFGAPSIQVDGRVVTLPYRKADALLYYLILSKKAARRNLVDLLWNDTDPASALKNLRHAVYTIRKSLGADLFLTGQRAVLELNPQVPLRCDVLDFLSTGALETYRGEFLSGFSLHADCPFEDWLTEQRNLLHAQYLKRLLAAAKDAFTAGDLARAEQLGLDYIELDPLEESACVVLMELYGRQKKFRKAIGVYHQLCKNLDSELSISPLKETTALYYRIVNEWNSSTYKIEERADHPMLGKDLVLRRLLAVCNGPLSQRRTPCILLQGEAGVGKTYLLSHILDHYDFSDRLVLRTFCYQSEAGVPLAPWNSVMLSLVSEIDAHRLSVPDTYLHTAAGLFPCLSLRGGRDYADTDVNYPLQHNYHVAMESALLILSMVARQIPLLLIFEDIHWIDRASAQLLSAFLHRMRSLDATVLCTSRESDSPHLRDLIDKGQRDKVLERYDIPSFSREETLQFIRHYWGRQPTPDQLDQIYQGTGGNALLLSQLVGSLRDSGGQSDISQILKGVLQYRLAQLSAQERQVLDMISAFTEWVSIQTLSSILTKDILELTYLCGQLKQRMLVAESMSGGTVYYTLAHDLIRSVLVQATPRSARRILHLRVAQCLENQPGRAGAPPFDRLVYHYREGGNQFKAFRYQVLFLNDFTGLSFDLMPTLPGAAGDARPDDESLPRYFQSLEKELRALRGQPVDQGELDRLEMTLLHAKSRYCVYNGLYHAGLKALEQLTALCRAAGDWPLLVRAHLQYVYYGIQTYNPDLMEEHLDVIQALLAGREASEDQGIYLRLRGLLQILRGQYPQARALLERSVQTLQALAAGADDRYAINIAGAYNYLAESYRMEGRYDEAFSYYDKAIVYNRSRGYYPGAAVFYTNYGVCAYQKGEYEAAYQLFLYAKEIYRTSHEYSGLPLALGYLALYEASSGDFDAAARDIREAHQVCDTIGSPWWKGTVIYLCWKIREHLERTGGHAPALEQLWPASRREHCLWGLSYLRGLPPRLECTELEQALRRLPADP